MTPPIFGRIGGDGEAILIGPHVGNVEKKVKNQSIPLSDVERTQAFHYWGI
jgi:hypothetical protein